MKILLHESVQLEFQDLKRRTHHRVDPTLTSPRSSGVHLSAILKHAAIEGGILTPAEMNEDEMPLRMMLGIAFEEFAASLYPDMVYQPGELERDGVLGTPDGLSCLDDPAKYGCVGEDYAGMLIVEEFKYTHKSCSNERHVPNLNSRQGVIDWWMWLSQVESYLAMHPTGPRLARFTVMYGVGDYQRPYSEKLYRTLIQFDQRELDSTWAMVMKYKKFARAEKH